MNRFFCFLVLLILPVFAQAQSASVPDMERQPTTTFLERLNQPFIPTRSDWLNLLVRDLPPHYAAKSVAYLDPEGAIKIHVFPTAGADYAQLERYQAQLARLIADMLKDYPWARDIELKFKIGK